MLRTEVLMSLFWFFPGQAVIQNPFSNGSSPAAETVGAETRFAYFPAATVSDGTATAVSVQATADPTITQAGGGPPSPQPLGQNCRQNVQVIVKECCQHGCCGASGVQELWTTRRS